MIGQEEKEAIFRGSLKVLGENCKTLRIAKKWSPYDLSAHSQVNVITIYAIERGEGNITIRTLESIAFALEVKSTELMSVSKSQ